MFRFYPFSLAQASSSINNFSLTSYNLHYVFCLCLLLYIGLAKFFRSSCALSKVGTTTLPILHNLLQCDIDTHPTRGGVQSPSPEFSQNSDLLITKTVAGLTNEQSSSEKTRSEKGNACSTLSSAIFVLGAPSCHVRNLTNIRPPSCEEAQCQ